MFACKSLSRSIYPLLRMCDYRYSLGKGCSTSVIVGFEFPEEHFRTIIAAHPSLYIHKEAVWNDVYGTLLKQGFDLVCIKKMLLKVPRILELQYSEINAVVKVFRNYNLQDRNTINLISNEPRLLLINPEALKARLGTMFTIFPRKDIVRLLKQGKCVHSMFFETWDSIYEKLRFIDENMGYDQSHMVRANVLQYSLEYIKLRYNFFLRCGKFKRPDPKVFDKKTLSLNVLLKCKDYDLPALTGVLKEDYEVFVRLFEEEDENENNDLNIDEDIT